MKRYTVIFSLSILFSGLGAVTKAASKDVEGALELLSAIEKQSISAIEKVVNDSKRKERLSQRHKEIALATAQDIERKYKARVLHLGAFNCDRTRALRGTLAMAASIATSLLWRIYSGKDSYKKHRRSYSDGEREDSPAVQKPGMPRWLRLGQAGLIGYGAYELYRSCTLSDLKKATYIKRFIKKELLNMPTKELQLEDKNN